MMIRTAVLLMVIAAAFSASAPAAEPRAPLNTQAETIPLTTPEQAAAMITVPSGFSVSLFASEPLISQPIGLATDSRGRLWVAENNTYAERHVNFDMTQNDRISILEDSDHDGRADHHKVFWDRGKKLTSVAIGFGGVWALCPPQLLFIPDRNGDDVPDGEPQVILDGWDDGPVRHNIANGLRWGPDGWLYGRHGIQATSHVGPPGMLPGQRTSLNCSIWRYHPTRKIFEVVCRGTTNPWGMDWNEHGELFFINTVIGHLWHAVPGAHFQRMYGEDDNPHLYELLGQTADHFHWDTADSWSKVSKAGLSHSTDQAGGGHAHCGLMFELDDNWPDRYRDTLFTINFHGRRLNNDILERQGCGYVARHGADFLKTTDPWFRGIEILAGSDGGAYIADWSDIGECHEEDGVHRSSGRIYKMMQSRRPITTAADVARASDQRLMDLQFVKNEWFVRESRQVLQERAAARRLSASVPVTLRKIVETDADPLHRLHALWCLHVTGNTPDRLLISLLGDRDEHMRSWAIRLLADGQTPSPDARRAFEALAARDPSGFVLLYLASASQQLPPADRWGLIEKLVIRSEFANDRVLPLMIWYGIEPAIPDDPSRAVSLAQTAAMPLVIRFIARRLTEDLQQAPDAADRLVSLARDSATIGRRAAILNGITDALHGWRKAPMPASWPSLQRSVASGSDGNAQRLVRDLSVVFGDGRSLDAVLAIARSKKTDLAARRDALRVLVDARDPRGLGLLRDVVRDRDLGADAARGLAAFDDPEIPGFLIRRYSSMKGPAQAAAIVSLSSRPQWARLLLEAIQAGRIERDRVPAFQVRQLATMPDEQVRRRAAELWPSLKILPTAKRERINRLKSRLDATTLAAANPVSGRRHFVQSCATCHVLFGQGHKIGPDLTGSQRANLDYLLMNIIDPSGTVSPDYRMSAIELADGRILNAIVSDRGGPTLALQTPTERLILKRDDIGEIHKTDLSLMPEGLLDVLSETATRDLIAYLMSPQQVPLTGSEKPAASLVTPHVQH